MWLLRQAELNETIDRISTLLSYEDNWIASNAALVIARLVEIDTRDINVIYSSEDCEE